MTVAATHRLYHDDATLLGFEAQVVRRDASGTQVALNRTAFYPTSGGQSHDIGTLNDISVLDVVEDGDVIVHTLADALPADAASVQGTVDFARRFDHMQQHSGQHLLSALLEDHFGWPTVSVHFGRDACALDLAVESVSHDALVEAERMVNAHITQNRAVTISYEDAQTATGLRKPSKRGGRLRIVAIDGLDRNACGGTHVARTGEIGVILLRRAERARDTTRLEFRCGQRAVQRARRDCELVQQIGAAFSAGADDVASLVIAQQAALRASDKERSRLGEQLAAFEARALYAATVPDAGGRRVHVESLSGEPVKTRQTFAQQFVQGDRAVYLVVCEAPPALLLAASHDALLDCAAVLRSALQTVGGRGGGTPLLAQGSVPSAQAAHECRDALLATLYSERSGA